MNRESNQRVLVLGGGVSGLAASIRLSQHGVDVTLMERAEFPREKICGCCLGAAGVSALDSIGVGEGVRTRGVPTTSLVGYLQTNSTNALCDRPIRLPISPGVAISRSDLDSYLMQCAIDSGVDVRQPHEAQVVDSDPEAVTVRHRQVGGSWVTADEYGLVILATGLTGVFQGKPAESPRDSAGGESGRWDLPWVDPPHGPLGIATHLPSNHSLTDQCRIGEGEIQMICGDDGYVGLVRLPDGSIDIAAALRSRTKQRSPSKNGSPKADLSADKRASPAMRIGCLLRSHPDWHGGLDAGHCDSLENWLEHDAHWMTAPPLRRTRQAGRGRVVAIGDCARYVEPLTGEGMTWGIESGIAVADLWNEIGKHERSANPSGADAVDHRSVIDFADQWNQRLSELQPKRRVICGSITGALRSRSVRQLTQVGLTHFGWLARPLTHGLASGPRFESTSVPQRG